MFKTRRRLSQNFLYNRKLVKKLVRQSSIGSNDLVVEIGPGKGIITQELLAVAGRVIAVEIDRELSRYLRRRFISESNFQLVQSDFLKLPLPLAPYKVFANTPLAIEGQVVRKLLNDNNPPQDSYLVARIEVAKRWAGISYRGQFSVSWRPWFDFSLVHKFQRQDFTPKPKVASVMLRIKRRDNPLLPWSQKWDYQRFIENQFMSRRRPSALTLDQWLENYRLFSRQYQVKPQRRK